MKKYKIITISDIPLVPSGCGQQHKFLIEGLLKTGRYTFRTIGGAIKHPSYNPIQIEPWNSDWIIFPRDNYGDKLFIRSILDQEKPDALWIFTDPRFFVWLWEMSDEILPRCPILYWHIWDNYPAPQFNKNFFRSTTYMGCISKLTHNVIKELGFENRSSYIPHAVPTDLFKPLPEAEVMKYKESILGKKFLDKKILFWNNRNARRKNPSDVLIALKELNEKNNNEFALLMHCNPNDVEGPNLYDVLDVLGISSQVIFSSERLTVDKMNVLYNIADMTINIAFAEGFGLSSLESLMAGTCILNQKTGGLQDQVDESDNWGVLLKPDNITMVGSQQIPYIFEERVNPSSVSSAIDKFFKETTREERRARGRRAREWAIKNFDYDKMVKQWDEAFCDVIENYKDKYHHFDRYRVHTL
jgi:glycosyltransferase involved in cell wall biosynthesis